MLYLEAVVGAVPNALTVTAVVVLARLIVAAGLGADSSVTAPKVLTYVYTYTLVSAVPVVAVRVGATVGAGTPSIW